MGKMATVVRAEGKVMAVQQRYRPYLGYRANQVREYVYRTIASEGIAPSYGMICAELGIATKGEVCRIIGDLERRGLVRRVGKGRVRRIRLSAV